MFSGPPTTEEEMLSDSERWAWIDGAWVHVHVHLMGIGRDIEWTVSTINPPHTPHGVHPRYIRRGDKPTEPPL